LMGDATLEAFLSAHNLAHLSSSLQHPATLQGLLATCLANRPEFLSTLKRVHGVASVSDRQRLANGLGKAVRSGELPALSTSEVLEAICEDSLHRDSNGNMVVDLPHYDVAAQQQGAAPSCVPLVLYQTNRTHRVGVRVWRNVCKILRCNPTLAYRFYDDERCERLICDHCSAETLAAFRLLRAGAAKADLWRYCCLFVHGGIYLDCDSGITRSLFSGDALIDAHTQGTFLHDAEANLIQWFLAAAPRHPVLGRAVTLSTARVLAQEPNIFVATGPSLFTDAFIQEHSDQSAARASDASAARTAMSWDGRLRFLQRHGSVAEDPTLVQRVYDGYAFDDVYAGGEAERYVPTWGAEPTLGLYHPALPSGRD
jgi:hypothetical protein